MDVWLLFGLTLPFISFVLSILEELLQDSEQQDEAKAFHLIRNLSNIRSFFTQVWTLRMDPKKVGCKVASFIVEKDVVVKMSKQRIIQIFGRIILPSITAAFVLVYIVAAAYLYSHPSLKYQ